MPQIGHGLLKLGVGVSEGEDDAAVPALALPQVRVLVLAVDLDAAALGGNGRVDEGAADVLGGRDGDAQRRQDFADIDLADVGGGGGGGDAVDGDVVADDDGAQRADQADELDWVSPISRGYIEWKDAYRDLAA